MQRFTGERVIPDHRVLRFTFLRHLVVYQAVQSIVSGKAVLDCGSGEGYGVSLLAETAASVVGIDSDRRTIDAARTKYARSNLQYQCADTETLIPFPDHAFDVAVCFQMVEHLRDPAKLLMELKRVLKPGGVAIFSTPNQLTFSPTRESIDPFHWQEYTYSTFATLLEHVFPAIQLFSLTGDALVLKLLKQDIRSVERIVRLDVFRMRRWLPRRLRQQLYSFALPMLRRLMATTIEGYQDLQTANFRIQQAPFVEHQTLDLLATCSVRAGSPPPALGWPDQPPVPIDGRRESLLSGSDPA